MVYYPIDEDSVNPGKFFKPPTGRDCIAREKLFEVLDEGAKLPLTMVTAPSGFGKSTLVSSWLETVGLDFVWYSLDDSDDSLPKFLGSFIHAARQKYPDFGTSLIPLLRTPNKLPVESLISLFQRALSEVPKDLILVLDDLHEIHDDDIHKLLYEAYRYPPKHFYLVLLARHQPPWPLRRLRKKGWIREIHPTELLFEQNELFMFNAKRGQKHSQEELDHIMKVTEGWPAGVRLLLTSKQNALGIGKIKYSNIEQTNFHDLIEYSGLNNPISGEFSLWMSAFEKFNYELGDFLLAKLEGKSNEARELINHLLAEDLFIIPLDDKNYAYRYHHLIRENLYAYFQAHRDSKMVRQLHALGGDWFYSNGYAETALKHYLRAGESSKALEIFRDLKKSYLRETNWGSFQSTLNLFPPEMQEQHRELRLSKAWLSAYTGDLFTMFEVTSDLSPVIWEDPATDPAIKSEWAVLEAYRQYNIVQDFKRSLNFSEYALANLPADHSYARGFAWIFLGGSLQVLEGTSEAAGQIREGLKGIDDPQVNSHQLMILNYIYWIDGKIPELIRVANMLVELGKNGNNLEAEANGLYFLGIAEYSLGNLVQATTYLSAFRKLRFNTIAVHHFMGLATLCLCNSLRGEEMLENQIIEELEGFVKSQKHPLFSLYLESLRMELLFRKGQFITAKNRIDIIKDIPLTPFSNSYIPFITKVKIYLSTGLEADLIKAEKEITRIDELLDNTNNLRYKIDLELLRSQVHFLKGEEGPGEAHLKAALALANVYQVIVPFLEMDQNGYSILGSYGKSDFPDIFKKLNALKPFEDSLDFSILTGREKQVLELILQNLSNKEIGNKLFISEKTVKRHAGNLFKKLGAKSRYEVILKMSDLSLT